jgi:hypothetical protein
LIFGVTVIILLILLTVKELVSTSESESSQGISSFLRLPIMILLALFVLTVALSASEIIDLDLLETILSP